MKKIAIIVAGGRGTRFGSDLPKQFLPLAGKPILAWALRAFRGADRIVVALPSDQMTRWQQLYAQCDDPVEHTVVPGGETRWHSVRNALTAVAPSLADDDVVAVHDAARPLASQQLIERIFAAAAADGGAVPCVPLADSVRQIDGDTSHALDRSLLRAVQTPQAFLARPLLDAYDLGYRPEFTDDASVFEFAGHRVTLVEGEPNNFKITRPADLTLAQLLLDAQ